MEDLLDNFYENVEFSLKRKFKYGILLEKEI